MDLSERNWMDYKIMRISYLSKEFDSGGICYDAVFGLCEGVSEQRICQSVRKKDKEIYTQRRKCKIAVCHGKAIFRYEVVGWKSIGSGGSNWNRKNDYISIRKNRINGEIMLKLITN